MKPNKFDLQVINATPGISVEETCECISQMAHILSLAIKGTDVKELEKYLFRWGEIMGMYCPVVEHMYRTLLTQMAFHE